MLVGESEPPEHYRLSTREAFSAWFLMLAALSVLIDKVSGNHGFALPALVLILGTIVTTWSRITLTSRLMAACAVGVTIFFAMTGGTLDAFLLAASRALFLPALLVMMTVLQSSAQNSEPVGLVARFVIDQPPSRRFGMLAITGHIFGMLLNLAGYRFLLGIALKQVRQMTTDPDILAIQERRIMNAILCGFGATIMWSPVGIALNLLLPLMEDFEWIDYAPYGISTMLGFIGLRYIFDRAEPRPNRNRIPASRQGVINATLRLMALLIGVTGSAALTDAIFGIPMQGSLLIVIAIAAVIWRLLDWSGPTRTKLTHLAKSSFLAMPRPANEIALLLATGYLGLILVELIPADVVRKLITDMGLSPAGLSAVIVLAIAGSSMIGISPMITGTVCVGAVIAAQIDIPYPILLLATLTGWSTGMLLSPVAATVGPSRQPASRDVG
jgi:hypothetical protein